MKLGMSKCRSGRSLTMTDRSWVFIEVVNQTNLEDNSRVMFWASIWWQ